MSAAGVPRCALASCGRELEPAPDHPGSETGTWYVHPDDHLSLIGHTTAMVIPRDVFGFVFTVPAYPDRMVPREHPAYQRPDGAIVWAPDRGYWRDAPADVAASFLPAGDAARAHMLERTSAGGVS